MTPNRGRATQTEVAPTGALGVTPSGVTRIGDVTPDRGRANRRSGHNRRRRLGVTSSAGREFGDVNIPDRTEVAPTGAPTGAQGSHLRGATRIGDVPPDRGRR